MHNKFQSRGRGTVTVLSTAFELVLVSVLISLTDWGFGRTFADVIAIVGGYLVSTYQNHLFPPNGTPGRESYQSFTKRWSHKLSIRVVGILCLSRLLLVPKTKKHIISIHFKNNFLKQISTITLRAIWGFDEIGFSGELGKQFIICRRGASRPLKLAGNNNKINYSR